MNKATTTKVYSSLNTDRKHILVYSSDEHVETLFNRVFRNDARERLQVSRTSYFYKPSLEWEKFAFINRSRN